MKSLRNTDLTEVAGYFLFKNLKDFINETLLDSEEKKIMEVLINETEKLFDQHMDKYDFLQYWEDQKNYELNGDIKEKDKDVPKFFGGSKEYDPKIIFDPDCLGNS